MLAIHNLYRRRMQIVTRRGRMILCSGGGGGCGGASRDRPAFDIGENGLRLRTPPLFARRFVYGPQDGSAPSRGNKSVGDGMRGKT